MRIFTIIIVSVFLSSLSFAQTAPSRIVSGSVVDTAGAPLPSVTVNLKSSKENLTVKTNTAGKFQFSAVTATDFFITITGVGYAEFVQSYIVGNTSAKAFLIDPVAMKIKTNELETVVITVSPITIKEDTIEYRADAYKVREGAPVEDVLKKLPGVSVDKDGVVTAQGKEVKRVRVNGKDYFGGDVITATQNLPADVIESIQIIDDYGDRANQTGTKEGEPEKILNFNVKRGMNKGVFGNGTVGAGTEERMMVRANGNSFKEDRQLSFVGSVNNTNANSFNFNAGGRGGGARGTNFGGGERGGAGGDGVTMSTSLGLNYRNSWGKKIVSYGSYSFSSRNNNTQSSTFTLNNNPLNTYTQKRISDNQSSSANHRITWNFEYKMDSANYLKVTPYYSNASSNNSNKGTTELFSNKGSTPLIPISHYTLSNTNSASNSTTPAYGSDLFYIHRFKRKGRNFNVSASFNYSARDQVRDVQNDYLDLDTTGRIPTSNLRFQNQTQTTSNINTTKNARFSFAEPIGKFTALEASYTWNNSKTESIRQISDVDAATGAKFPNLKQSNDYDYTFVTNRFGLNLHSNKTKYNYYIGMVVQPSTLTGFDRGREITTVTNNMNYAPNARFAYNFSRSHSITASYNGNSREPSFNQLQPVSDSTNIKNIITGNPNLRPEFTNRFSLQYNKVEPLKGSSLFANLSFDETNNKIVSSWVYQDTGTGRSTSYLNTNGFYGVNGNVSLTQPFLKKKLTVTINTSGSYDNNLSFIDNHKNNGNNWTIRPGARVRVDLPDIIDININSNYYINKNIVKYDTGGTTINTLKRFTLGVEGKNFFFKHWTLGYDFNKVFNTGFNSSQNSNPMILNMYVERRFLKNNKATIRLQGFDLFNQNTGINREINSNGYTDEQNNRLARYFLLTFNLRLQKFAGRQPTRMPGDRMNTPGGGQRNGQGGGQGGGQRNGGGGGGTRNN